jgi:hypothetical protein
MAEMQAGHELKGKPGELRFTVEVKRAATGKVETYEMTGRVTDGGDALDGGAQRCD